MNVKSIQVSHLWKDQVGSLKGLWVARARRIGCRTRELNKQTLERRGERGDLDSSTAPGDPGPGGESEPTSIDWKTECVAGMRLRHLLDAGKAWTHEELVNLVKSPGRLMISHLMPDTVLERF